MTEGLSPKKASCQPAGQLTCRLFFMVDRTDFKRRLREMPDEADTKSQDILDRLMQYIKDIKFGSVTVVIQDGKIVQIKKNEKVRLR